MQKLRVNSLVFYLTDEEHDKIKGVGQTTSDRILYLTEHCEVCVDASNNTLVKCRGPIEDIFNRLLM